MTAYNSLSRNRSHRGRSPAAVAGRRRFLQGLGTAACGGWLLRAAPALAVPQVLKQPRKGQWRRRNDLLGPESPPGLEVIQLTSEPDVPSSHLYMEAQIFTLDSKRFVLHRSAHAHGSNENDPQHQYLLCDLENDFQLSPLTEELGATGASVSPDGRWVYYFVNETEPGGGRLTLRRVQLDGTQRETIVVIDKPLPARPSAPATFIPSRQSPPMAGGSPSRASWATAIPCRLFSG